MMREHTRTRLGWVFVFGGCAMLGACSTSVDTHAESPTMPSHARMGMDCPLGIPGARVDAENTAEGVALTFTAPAHRVDELRLRARYAAEMHGPFAWKGPGHDGTHGHGGRHGVQAMQLPPSRADVTVVDGGARIELAPVYPADREFLVTKARDATARMNTAACR